MVEFGTEGLIADLHTPMKCPHWEWVNPPLELPTYVGDFAQALMAIKAWITTSRIAKYVEPIATAPPKTTRPLSESNGKSEVPGSDEEPDEKLLPPCWLVSKVQQSDQVEHTLDKGAWVVMPTVMFCNTLLAILTNPGHFWHYQTWHCVHDPPVHLPVNPDETRTHANSSL